MTATNFISGLVSTLDWANVVDQLMQIAHRRVDVLEDRKGQFEGQQSAWQDLNSKLLNLLNEATTLRSTDAFALFNASLSTNTSTEASELLSVQVGSSAHEGTYQIEILSVAQARRLSTKGFSAPDEALGLQGEVIVGSGVLSVTTTDTLYSLRDKINDLDAGVRASVVTVSSGQYRLILTAEQTGSEGFSVRDASSAELLQALGLSNGTTRVREVVHDGALSVRFTSTTDAVGTLLGLDSAPSGTVQIRGNSVTIDLSTDSLTTIRDKILAAGVDASIETVTADGQTYYRLKIGATLASDYVDQNNVLEALGILEEGQSDVAQVLTTSNSLTKTSAAGGGYITASTTWAEIDTTGSDSNDITNGDTITILGRKHDGTQVEATYTITDKTTDTVQGLLDAIAAAFGGEVTAEVTSDGRIRVTDNTAGDSLLELALIANNEGGGSLDFGEVEVTTTGYSMEVAQGQDARLRIDGTLLERSTNAISDALPGLTLNLRASDPSTTITLQVSRDLEGIQERVQGFVEDYNEVITFINQQFTYDEEEGGGPLMGSTTLRSIQSHIRSIVSGAITGLPDGLNALSLIGVTSDRYGLLSIDSEDFQEALDQDFEGVMKIFVAWGETTTSDLQYIYHSTQTEAGTYTVSITQVATQASVTGTVDLSTGIAGDETITVTELGTNKEAVVSLTAGQTIDDIVNALNSEFSQQGMRIRAENSGGYLKLIHLDYGSSYGFTVSQTANYTGITDGTYQGVDVAGSIGGEAAEGSGQYLTGSTGAVEGLMVKYTGTATGDVGSVTLTFGVAEQLYRALEVITDPYEGLVKVETDGLQDRIQDMEEQIEAMEARLEKKRETLMRQFVAMENALAQLRALSDWLTQQIAANFR